MTQEDQRMSARLVELYPDEIPGLADMIAERTAQRLGTMPLKLAEYIRMMTGERAQNQVIPILYGGPYQLVLYIRSTGDGSLFLDWKDYKGDMLWSQCLRPESFPATITEGRDSGGDA